MKSHEYAEKLKAAAEFLLAREDVEIGSVPTIHLFFYEKEPFVGVVPCSVLSDEEVAAL